ncbi:uncharacterized protein MONBRDRAFT_5849 [Monosiga brevicollis MX1]|uniref:Methyltransferase small domain-containing protein n=1 Tax=Monosiga brevicollis TaxID=81824 RepID=A9USN2_MONBE|nr:uncharacterized protein MONBRDRAFT_5849 [Monosiga brevicollis MX1]EDQ92131.1 predicted protein [Monosiga brevicollis MX1]|eukprot:XP_001743417.1 hypothetical protein [Monosiga brevicollis MX1]
MTTPTGGAAGVTLPTPDYGHVTDEVARETGRRNQIDIETYRGDLAAAFPPELRGRLDVLLFNPPYVVTDTEEISTTSLAATWAGGAHGREVLDRLLPEIPSLLSARGRFYLIALKENLRPDTPDDLLAAIPGMRGAIVVSRKCGRERLNVVCYTRTPSS